MKYDVGIIGSGPAGLSAAIYAKRANLSAVVIEKEYEGTGQIAESGQVDNYPGFPGISGYDLGENFREHAVKLGVSFMEQEVTEIKKEASSDFELVFAGGSENRNLCGGSHTAKSEYSGRTGICRKGCLLLCNL